MITETPSLFIAAIEVIKSPIMTNLTPSFYLLNAGTHTFFFATIVSSSVIFFDLANQLLTQLTISSLDSQLLICDHNLKMLQEQLTSLIEMQNDLTQTEFTRDELLDFIRVLQSDQNEAQNSCERLRNRREAMQDLFRQQIDDSASKYAICKKIVFWSPLVGFGLGLVGLGLRYALRGPISAQ